MRNAGGYAVETMPYGESTECDTFTCNHCQRVTFVRPRADPFELGGGCRICQGLICSKCVDRGTCTPWEKQMEIAESKFETDRMISRLVGRE